MILSLALAFAADTVVAEPVPAPERASLTLPLVVLQQYPIPPIRTDGFGVVTVSGAAPGDPAGWLRQTPGWVVNPTGSSVAGTPLASMTVYVDGLRVGELGAWAAIRRW